MGMDYRAVLGGELVLLITGITGAGMLHGVTEGASYTLRPWYTPYWLCWLLLGFLSLTLLDLIVVTGGLYFDRPQIVMHHALLLIGVVAVLILAVLVALALGAPFLVCLLLVLYLLSLTPFAYLLFVWEWEKPESSA